MKTFRGTNRAGLTIAELVVSLVIFSIIGMAFTRLLVSQARYFDHQTTGNAARNVSRGPLNRIVSDLRMVEATQGVLEAGPTSVLLRVPYAMGVVCANVSGNTHISLLPVDSAMFSGGGFSGYAWRRGDGTYRYVEEGPPLLDLLGDVNVCNQAAINWVLGTNSKIIRLSPALVDTASVGTPVFLFRRLRYEFLPSQSVPGTMGLYRTVVGTGETEELSAPYAPNSGFRYYEMNNSVPGPAPADLSRVRGIELQLFGMSERAPSGAVLPQKAPFTTGIFFKNRLN